MAQIDVSQYVSVTKGGFLYNRLTRKYEQNVSISNTSGSTKIYANIDLHVINLLPSGNALYNANGTHSDGHVYRTMWPSGVLSPGDSTGNVKLIFTQPGTTYDYHTFGILPDPISATITSQSTITGTIYAAGTISTTITNYAAVQGNLTSGFTIGELLGTVIGSCVLNGIIRDFHKETIQENIGYWHLHLPRKAGVLAGIVHGAADALGKLLGTIWPNLLQGLSIGTTVAYATLIGRVTHRVISSRAMGRTILVAHGRRVEDDEMLCLLLSS